ncbi:hypothetical protein [Chamaesiphon sp. GL140_3_metabinner_50]|nr:hypothetical protein [Chamaesiphon sp. GL140_3_metabinner_50]
MKRQTSISVTALTLIYYQDRSPILNMYAQTGFIAIELRFGYCDSTA